jgi:hypothetical protein
MKNRYQWYEQFGENILTEDTIARIVEEGKDHPDFKRETHECLHAKEKAITQDGKVVTMCILCGARL